MAYWKSILEPLKVTQVLKFNVCTIEMRKGGPDYKMGIYIDFVLTTDLGVYIALDFCFGDKQSCRDLLAVFHSDFRETLKRRLICTLETRILESEMLGDDEIEEQDIYFYDSLYIESLQLIPEFHKFLKEFCEIDKMEVTDGQFQDLFHQCQHKIILYVVHNGDTTWREELMDNVVKNLTNDVFCG
jgi:hypothetical protein